LAQGASIRADLTTSFAIRRKGSSTRWIVLVYQNECDYDGLSDSLYLDDSFASEAEAVQAAKALPTELLKVFESGATGWGGRGMRWSLVGEVRELQVVQPAGDVREAYRCGFTVRGGQFDRKRPVISVVGPFAGELVDRPLADFVDRGDLCMYLWSVGRAKRSGGERPRPYSYC
jgi:hypothetical protein